MNVRTVTAAVRRYWPVALAAAVILVDQATKWVAGHGGPTAYVLNTGVSRDNPRMLDGLLAAPVAGSLVDLLRAAGVVAAAYGAWRTRGLIRTGLTLYAAGGAGNLLDRLGMSFLAAPDPHARGVVDLAVLGDANVADQALRAGVLVLAVAALLHTAGGPARVVNALIRVIGRVRWRPVAAVVCTAVAGVWAGAMGQHGATRKAQADASEAKWHAAPTARRVATIGPRWVELPATARLADMRARCHGDPFAVIPTRAGLLVRCRA